MMSILFRALRGLALALFVLSAPLYLLALSLAATTLRPETYHRLLDDLHAPERLRPALARIGLTRTLPLTTDDPDPRPLPPLPPSAWETMGAELLPADWLNAQAHALVDATFAWLESDDLWPGGRVDLGLVLDRLQGAPGAAALIPLLGGAPPCGAGETPTGIGIYASCLPPQANVEGLAAQSALRLTHVLPRSLGLESLLALGLVGPGIAPQLDLLHFTYRWAKVVVSAGGSFCLLLLALYGLLAIRDWRGLISGPVAPLSIAGALTLMLGSALWGTARAGGLAASVLPGAGELAREAVDYLVRAAALRVMVWGAGLLLLAALLWGVTRFLQSRQRQPAPPERRQTRVRRQFI
jgi:hypothetical protein